MNYNEFLHTKIEVAPVSGFEVRREDIHPALKPHQKDAVGYLRAETTEIEQPSLFDLMEQEVG